MYGNLSRRRSVLTVQCLLTILAALAFCPKQGTAEVSAPHFYSATTAGDLSSVGIDGSQIIPLQDGLFGVKVDIALAAGTVSSSIKELDELLWLALLPKESSDEAHFYFDASQFVNVSEAGDELSVEPDVSFAPRSASRLVLDDDMEVLPGEWDIWVSYGAANAYWDDWSCGWYTDGDEAAGCADLGSDGIGCGENYPNNMSTIMIRGPFDLSDATGAGIFSFDAKLNTETYFDFMTYGVSIDGVNFHGRKLSGQSEYQNEFIRLEDVPVIGDVLGERRVWIAFYFESDGSVSRTEGAQVDDVKIQVQVADSPLPDLVVANPSAPATAAPGSAFRVSLDVYNDGEGNAAESRLAYYLSPGAGDTRSEYLQATDSANPLTPGGDDYESAILSMPGNAQPGDTWYVVFEVDYVREVRESDEGNNVTSLPVRVEPGVFPDLIVSVTTDPAAPFDPGEQFTVFALVSNQSSAATGVGIEVRATYAGQTLWQSTNALGPYESRLVSIEMMAPQTNGSYSIDVTVDPSNVIEESNEGNNSDSAPGDVAPTLPCHEFQGIRICGGSMTQSGDTYRFEGPVEIDDVLWIDGYLEVIDGILLAQGSGRIYVPGVPIDGIDREITLYDGSFAFTLLGPEGSITNFIEESVNDYGAVVGLELTITELRLNVVNREVVVSGKLVLPELLDGSVITVEALRISPSGLSFEEACLYSNVVPGGLPDVKLPGGVGLDINTLCFASDPLRLEFDVEVSAKIVTIQSTGEIVEGGVNRITFDLEVGHGVPLGSTGLFLTGANGGLDHLQDAEPVEITLGCDITAGPSSPVSRGLVTFDNVQLTVQYPDQVRGSGRILIYDEEVSTGHIALGRSAGVTMLELQASANIRDVLLADMSLRVSGSEFFGSSNGTLQVPELEGFPFDLLNAMFGLPYSIVNTHQTVTNERIEGIASITLWPFPDLSLAHRIEFGPPVHVYLGSDFESLRPIFSPYVLAAAENAAAAGRSIGFLVGAETRLIVVRVSSPGGISPVRVISPGGESWVPSGATPAERSRFIYEEDVAAGKSFYMLAFPAEGQWTVELSTSDPDVIVDCFSQSNAPGLRIDQRDAQAAPEFEYEVWGDSNGELGFYYDNDRSGADGVQIGDRMPVTPGVGNFVWDTSLVPSGEYFVYGKLEIAGVPPIVVYGSDPIVVEDVSGPTVPTGLRVAGVGESVQIEWDPVAGVEGYRLRAWISGELSEPIVSAMLWAPVSSVSFLVPGRTYEVAVQSLAVSGSVSLWSTPVQVTYVSSTQNNAPWIESVPPDVARVGEMLVYQIIATDADGDPLSYGIVDGPAGMTISSTGLLTWQVPDGAALVPRPAAVVSDPGGAEAAQLLTTVVVPENYGHARMDIDMRLYVGEEATVKIALFDEDVAVENPVVVARCEATSSEVRVSLVSTGSRGGYEGVLPLVQNGAGSEELQVAPGATVELEFADQTTGQLVVRQAVWVASTPLEGSASVSASEFDDACVDGFVYVLLRAPFGYPGEALTLNDIRALGQVPPDPDFLEYTDVDDDGVTELRVRFSCAVLSELVACGPGQLLYFTTNLVAVGVSIPVRFTAEIGRTGGFEVVFGDSWSHIPLQQVLDDHYGAGVIDAARDYSGYRCSDARTPYWVDDQVDVWMVREIAGFLRSNVMGWHMEDFSQPVIDGIDDGVIFEGRDDQGAATMVHLPASTRFGFYMNPNGTGDSSNAPEPEIFFANRFYNDIGPDGAGAVHPPYDGDPQCLIYNVTHLRGGVPTYVLAWEDLDSGAEITPSQTSQGTDNDFTDMVVEVQAMSPVPTMVKSFEAKGIVSGAELRWELAGSVDEIVIARRSPDGSTRVVASLEGSMTGVFIDAPAAGAGTYWYNLGLVRGDNTVWSGERQVELRQAIPMPTRIVRAQPNPFNPRTQIDFVLAQPGLASVKVIDVAGRIVRSLDLGNRPAGPGSVVWNGVDDAGAAVSSGVYLVRLYAGGIVDQLKVTLLK